ncbi:MAG: bifunctional folylpolyglutamate synthase/dihydrofolate synthase [Oscillospiraceae bacterium]|nr:bifunctional folylpolyglutamate synthase/dihydrofolate synthase [Oscillospiraceae bacterium]
MTCAEAIAYILSIPRLPPQPDLVRMNSLANRLGNPQKLLRCIHIAGTNGKGSTAAMTAAVLSAADYKTGLFTSPYLEQFQERIQIDGTPISPGALSRLTELVQQQARSMEKAGEGTPTAFEQVTAIGFLYFLEQHCDFVVLEAGLGGRLDATNIIPPPLAAAVTSISRDHTGVLGGTLEQIALQKCGILKKGSRGVAAPGQPSTVLSVIREHCRTQAIPLLEPVRPSVSQMETGLWGSRFSLCGKTYAIPLLGLHQIDNAVTSLSLIRQLRAAGYSISQEAEERGLGAVRWPGRLELICSAPQVLLDAAHNPGGIASLCDALNQYFPDTPPVTVMGMLSDKEYALCAAELARRSRVMIAVSPPECSRAVPAEKFAEAAAPYCPDVRRADSLSQALEQGLELVGKGGLLLVCGSIPLIGSARTELIGRHLECGERFF